MATGCINGEITIYDFELSKIEGMLIGHTGDITAIKFLSPYPMLVSASMDSTVMIWCVRPCITKYLNVCVRIFENISWFSDRDAKSTVQCLEVWTEKMKGIKQYRRTHTKEVKNPLSAEAYRNFEQNFVFS